MEFIDQLIAYSGIGGGGAAGSALWMNFKTRERLSEFKTHVAENYARSEDVKDLGDRLEKHLTRIEDKLDKKADK